MPIDTFRTFANSKDARTHRHEHGTGGWIFENEIDGKAILFPPHMTPSNILTHALTRGQAGLLIGSM